MSTNITFTQIIINSFHISVSLPSSYDAGATCHVETVVCGGYKDKCEAGAGGERVARVGAGQ